MGWELARPPARQPAHPAPAHIEKLCKIMKNIMNQDEVTLFELILRQDGATASRNPLQCLLATKTIKKSKKYEKCFRGPGAPLGPPVALRCSAALRQPARAIYAGP